MIVCLYSHTRYAEIKPKMVMDFLYIGVVEKRWKCVQEIWRCYSAIQEDEWRKRII
jgi:hypothetical protein